MVRVTSVLFFFFCFATSWVSSNMMGAGMWFWIMIAAGIFVAISSFVPIIENLGAAVAGLMATLSVIAIALSLMVATVGGSFDLDGTGLLLFLFGLIAVSGFLLGVMNKKKMNREEEDHQEQK